MPKIYVTLATYNGDKYLAKMLDSLCAQTVSPAKIIAVDDGSRDTTVSILESYKDKLPLDIYPQKENKGHRAAFSLALEIAQKEAAPDDFIALADQDDVWLPEKLEILSRKIGGADLVFGDAEVIGKGGEKIADSWRALAGIIPHLTTSSLLTGFTDVTGCLTLFRASLLSFCLPLPRDIIVHDQWIVFCASLRNGYIPVTDKVIQYRIHDNNAIGLGTQKSWSERLAMNLQWITVIINNPLFAELSPGQQRFAKEYKAFLFNRFHKNFRPQIIFWTWKHRKSLFPQCRTFKEFAPRALFSAIGTKPALAFFGKK